MPQTRAHEPGRQLNRDLYLHNQNPDHNLNRNQRAAIPPAPVNPHAQPPSHLPFAGAQQANPSIPTMKTPSTLR